MASSFTEYSNPNAAQFTINFPYLSASDVYAFLDGIDITNKIDSVVGSLVTFSETIQGSLLRIYRVTAGSTLDFQNKTIIRAEDLNELNLRNQYISQEARDFGSYDALRRDLTDSNFTAEGKRLKYVADPIEDEDAVNLKYVTDLYGSTASAAVSASAAAQSEINAANSANVAGVHASNAANSANSANASASAANEDADRAAAYDLAMSRIIEVVSGLDGGDARGITLAIDGGASNSSLSDSYEGGDANRADPNTTFEGGGAI